MLKVVSFTICPFVQRVTALLEAKQIPYEVEYISLSNKPQWFMELSPHGQVPILLTEAGQVLFESDAIVEYLDEAYPALLPDLAPEQKAVNRAWSYLAAKNYLTQCSAQRSPTMQILNERSLKLEKAFAAIEAVLGDTPFFNTDKLGMVDIAWLPILHRAELIEAHAGYDFLAGFPKVKVWQRRLLETGLMQRSIADDFEDAFAGFYLSAETYLGGRKESCDVAEKACETSGCC